MMVPVCVLALACRRVAAKINIAARKYGFFISAPRRHSVSVASLSPCAGQGFPMVGFFALSVTFLTAFASQVSPVYSIPTVLMG
jgi:hypothetical protein